MKVTLVILSAFVVLFFFAAFIIAAGLNVRIEELSKDLQVNKSLYDNLEVQVSKQYDIESTLGARLEAVERSVANLEVQKEEDTRRQNKPKSKKRR